MRVSEDSFLRKKLDSDSSDSTYTLKTVSRGLLFTNADKAGNKDGRVTKMELYNILDSFDEDGDGEITTGNTILETLFGSDTEWDKLEAQYEEREGYKSYKK